MTDVKPKRSKKDNFVEKVEKRPPFNNSAEEEICERFNILPQDYVMIKQILIR